MRHHLRDLIEQCGLEPQDIADLEQKAARGAAPVARVLRILSYAGLAGVLGILWLADAFAASLPTLLLIAVVGVGAVLLWTLNAWAAQLYSRQVFATDLMVSIFERQLEASVEIANTT